MTDINRKNSRKLYADRVKEARALLAMLSASIDDNQSRANAENIPLWDYAGSMGELVRKLTEAHDFIRNRVAD